MYNMRLLKTFQAEKSNRKADIYFDTIQNEFLIEYYDESGDYVTTESFRNKKIEFVESVAINWVIAKFIYNSVINIHKHTLIMESLSDILRNSIHKQQNYNEMLSQILIDKA